ncbi:MAG: 4,5-dihydroxyphthalate decarboxylase [Chloroflexota bacterium]|jgi:4,5-dihydroxyphthalate decarboxylase|nr:4,5-dihydroxyphthalate decarboxylase [Chloroflexota bacterium]
MVQEVKFVRLRTLLDTYGHTKGLKDGSVRSALLDFELDEVRPIYDGFPRTIRRDDFDLSELSTVTWLQAHAAGTPWMLLPVGLLNRFHHGSIIHNVDRGLRSPADLAGRRVGVRANTQTTAVWVRGILETEYGVDSDSVTWVSFEDGHMPDYVDPPNVLRAPPGRSMDAMLLDGEIDAAVVGRVRPDDPRVQDLIPDAARIELEWFGRTGVLPINHMLVIRRDLVDEHSWLLGELSSMLRTCRAQYLEVLRTAEVSHPDDVFRASLVERGIDPLPFGVEAVRPALELMIDFSVAQRLIPRRVSVDELFDPRTATFS